MIKKNILSVCGLIVLMFSLQCGAASYCASGRLAFLQGLHPRLGGTSPIRFLSADVVRAIVEFGVTPVILVNSDGNTVPIRVKMSDISEASGNSNDAPVVWNKVLVPFFNIQSNTPQDPPVYNVVPVVVPVNNLRISLYTHSTFDASDPMKNEKYIGSLYPCSEHLVGLVKMYVAQEGCVLLYKDNTEIVVRRGKRVGSLEMQPRSKCLIKNK